MPDWLRKKRCIYAIDTFDDDLCVWRCHAIYKRHVRGEENQVEKRNWKVALNLAREYYGDNTLKQKDVKPTKPVCFEGIAKHRSVNIMLFEPKEDRGEDAGFIRRLVYGKIQYKSDLPTVNMGLFGGHCFYIKKMDVLCKRWECKGCKQIFTRNENLTRRLKEKRCTWGKTKIICSDGKIRRILNSSEMVFHGGDTKFSYTACQWIEAQAVKKGKHFHHKICGHSGKRTVKDWVLNDKGKKTPVLSSDDGYELVTNTVYQFHGYHWHGHTCKRIVQKDKERDIKIRVRSIGL